MIIQPRRFKYQDQGGTYIIDELQIMLEYYPQWKERMIAIGKADEATSANCIEDWIVVHWAEEIPRKEVKLPDGTC